MKKILVVLAVLSLPCFPLFSQEADDTGAGVGFTVIPRIDLAPEFYDDGSGEFTLGNSSIYTLFEGNINEKLSFFVQNHWAAFYGTKGLFDDTKSLYENPFRQSPDWLDVATLTWTEGDFSLTVGKDAITTGGLEVDEYDFDMHYNMCSSIWNMLQVYQLGAKFGWNMAEDQLFTFQASTSPYVWKLFDKAWINYSLGWRGMLAGSVETIWSATAIQQSSDKFFYLLSLGNRMELDGFTLGLDLNNASMQSGDLAYGLSVIPSASTMLNDSLELFARGGFEFSSRDDVDYNCWFAGAGVNWTPVEDLRVHATASYNKLFETACVSLGATYFLRLGK